MYHSFEAKNFRCFQHLTMKKLARVNLIAGFNNVGKTALLEALFLHCGAPNPELIKNILGHRGIPKITSELTEWGEGPWSSLFNSFDTTKRIELTGHLQDTGRRTLQLRVIRDPDELREISALLLPRWPSAPDVLPFAMTQALELAYRHKKRDGKVYWVLTPDGPFPYPKPPPPPFRAFIMPARTRVPIKEDEKRFSDLEVEDHLEVLLEALRIIEPKLQKLSLNIWGGLSLIHAQVKGGRLVPLFSMGEGMVRITSLVLEIAAARGGVVLVDEIENGLHYSILADVWRAIAGATQMFDAQLFATTHSWECILAAHRTLSKATEYDFRLHRLDRTDDVVRAVAYDKDSIEGAIKARLEVR